MSGHTKGCSHGFNYPMVDCGQCIQRSRAQLLEALEAVLADHDERVGIYGESEQQPNRLRVMEEARAAIQAAKGSA